MFIDIMKTLNNINKLYYFGELKYNFNKIYKRFKHEIKTDTERKVFSLEELKRLPEHSLIDVNTNIYEYGTYNRWHEILMMKYEEIMESLNAVYNEGIDIIKESNFFEMSSSKIILLENALKDLELLEEEYSLLYEEVLDFRNIIRGVIPVASVESVSEESQIDNRNLVSSIPQKNADILVDPEAPQESGIIFEYPEAKATTHESIEEISKLPSGVIKSLFNDANLSKRLDEIDEMFKHKSFKDENKEKYILAELRFYHTTLRKVGGSRKKRILKNKLKKSKRRFR